MTSNTPAPIRDVKRDQLSFSFLREGPFSAMR